MELLAWRFGCDARSAPYVFRPRRGLAVERRSRSSAYPRTEQLVILGVSGSAAYTGSREERLQPGLHHLLDSADSLRIGSRASPGFIQVLRRRRAKFELIFK